MTRAVVARLGRHPSLVVLLSSVVVTSAFLAVAPPSLGPAAANDYQGYYRPVAESLLHGRGYVLDGEVDLHNPPGYPYVLVCLYALARLTHSSQDAWLTAFSVGCTGLSAVLAHSVARQLYDRATAWTAAAAFALYPLVLVMASYRFSEVPYTTALLLVVVTALRAVTSTRAWAGWALVSGLCCAAAALVRPAAIGLALPVGLALLLQPRGPTARRRAASAALVVLGFLVGVAPWEAWVHAKTGRVIALSEVGPEAASVGVLVGARGPVLEPGDPVFVPQRVRAMSARLAEHREELRSTGDIVHRLADQPEGDVALLVASKAVRAFYGTDSFKLEPLILLVQLPCLTLMAAGLAISARSSRPLARWAPRLLALVFAYSWVVTMTALSIVRYTAPALALLTVPAAAAVVALVRRLSRPAAPARGRARPAA